YRGSEIWFYALTDPDNRTPVYFERYKYALNSLINGLAENKVALADALARSPEDDRTKLHVVHAALEARNEHPDLFSRGKYEPLQAYGNVSTKDGAEHSANDHIIAFGRSFGDEFGITVAPRRLVSISGNDLPPLGKEVWQDSVVRVPEELIGR